MLLCPQCGRENPEGARFCNACGTPLSAEPPGAEERKVVSVLFADLVGFTASSDRADPEDVRATLRPYHARVKREIERFGGTVEKFVGDAVMAVFGAPVAHEDDAERAVRAALRILDAIGELNEAEGLELAVRAAVDTGEAVVALGARSGEGAGIATGDVVNTAARLQNAAPVGGLVVGDATYRATSQLIDYEELEPVELKGKAEPVPLWRALGAKSRFGVDAEAAPATPFVGRETELRLLRDTYERMLGESTVQLVTITGEPGVGKTRLLAEFRTWVDDRPEIVYWRQGRCLPYGEGITFWALGEIVKAQAGILDSDGPDEAAAKLASAVGSVAADEADNDWLRARLAPLVGVESLGSAGREESFAAWQRFLEGVAAERPLVLLFEDLHWADEPLVEFVDHVADASGGLPLLVICSARPELYERHAGWGGGKRNSTTVSLSPLSTEETARLIAALLERPVLPAETQTALLERCGGNPLYAEEFVRMLRDRGERAGAIPVPETVQALIAARLDTLPPERKALLGNAAVVGKVFWAGALEAMGGEGVREALRQLARKELVRPARASSVEGEAEYAFWHGLIRDVAYGQIPRAARAEKHRAAAEWIERIAGERVADHAALIAHHYLEAFELARAAGVEDQADDLKERAARYLGATGDQALRLDIAAAESFYRRALELTADDGRRVQALKSLSWVLYLAGRLGESEASSEEAVAVAQANGDAAGEAGGLLGLAQIAWAHGDRSRSEDLSDAALALLEREPPSWMLVRAYGSRAGGYMHEHRPLECIEWADRAIAVGEEIGADDQVVRARQFRGFGLCQLGRVEEGLAELNEALRGGLELGLGAECVTAYVNLGDILWWTEGPTRGLETFRTAAEFALRRGLTTHAMWATVEQIWTLYELGRWDEVVELSERLTRWGEEHGDSRVELGAVPHYALVLARRGRSDEAARLLMSRVERARATQDRQIVDPTLAFAAQIEQERGHPEAVRELAAAYEEETRGQDLSRLGVLPVLVRACAAIGALDLADGLLEGVGASMAHREHSLVTCLAVAAEAHGKLDEAAQLYADAVTRWAGFGFVLEEGEALLGLGRVGKDLEALGRARDIFARLGATVLLAETDGLLGQLATARAAR